MFNLFKKKNKIKELETRISALEANVIYLKQQDEVNGDLILQIDGDTIGKIALNQLKKIQRQGNIKLNCV